MTIPQPTVICFGEILMRLTTPENKRFSQTQSFSIEYGGNEANVAYSLANMNVPTAHVSCLPIGDLGDAILADLHKSGVDTRYVIREEGRLGMYFLEMGLGQRPSHTIYDRLASAMAKVEAEKFDWEKILTGADWLHISGTTPGLSAQMAQASVEAAQTAKRLGVPVSFDVTSRNDLWNWGESPVKYMRQIAESSDLILCGKDEATQLLDIETDNRGQLYKALFEHFPQLKYSSGTKKAGKSTTLNSLTATFYNNQEWVYAPEYTIHPIVDRVGINEAFISGLIYGLLHFEDDFAKSLHFGLATAVLKHSQHGEYSISTVAEIESLIAGY